MICPDIPTGIYSAGLGRRDTAEKIIVGGIQSIYKRPHELGWFSLAIVDECFPADTMISTPRGDMPIEDIYIGQSIFNAAGTGTIEAISVRNIHKLILLKLNNEQFISVTPNHPFFTDQGWVEAGKLARGSRLYSRKDVQMLRQSVQAVDQIHRKRDRQEMPGGTGVEQAKVLFDILFEHGSKSHVQQINPQEDFGRYARTTTDRKNGSRKKDARPETVAEIVGTWLENGACNHHNGQAAIAGGADSLQDRHCQSGLDDCNRDRRGLSPALETSGGRSAKGSASDGIRVEDIEIVEFKSPMPVFNLQVSNHPSYYAGGALVHNCHMIPLDGDGMYRTLLNGLKESNPAIRLIGLTATPYRLKGGFVCGADNPLNEICYEVGVKELIRDNYLSPLISKAGARKPDFGGLHIRGGEFVQEEVEALVDTEDNVQMAVNEIIKLTKHRKTVLMFAVSVRHAQAVQAEFLRLGIECEIVTGETPASKREQVLQRFKGGTPTVDLFGTKAPPLKYLVNVQVLTTGFDAPNIDCVVLLRPTASPGLYYQMVGRGFRLAEGKDNCLVLDYGGNILRHGPIDQIGLFQVKQNAKKETSGTTTLGAPPQKECPNCHNVVFASFTACPDCGFPFRKFSHDGTASDADVISEGDVHEDERLEVTDYRFFVHRKRGADDDHPKTVRVEYRIGLMQVFQQYICVEHIGKAREKAEQWWRELSREKCPHTAEDAVAILEHGGAAKIEAITVNRGLDFPVKKVHHGPLPELMSDIAFADALESIGRDDEVPF